MKIELYILTIIALASTVTSCSNKLNTTSNLSQTQIYLQSVDRKETQSNEYGYTIEDPIVLRLCEKFCNEKIISEYIERLSKNGEGESAGKIQSFRVNEKSKILMKSDIGQNVPIDDSFKSCLFKYNIISDDGYFKETLYFKLSTSKNEFYIPTGFIYSMYSD